MKSKYILILTTVSNKEEGKKLSSLLVENGMAACVNILPKMTSIYKWEAKVQMEEEYQLIIKTIGDKEVEILKYIKDNHSYATPEVITVEINNIDKGYRDWLNSCIKLSE